MFSGMNPMRMAEVESEADEERVLQSPKNAAVKQQKPPFRPAEVESEADEEGVLRLPKNAAAKQQKPPFRPAEDDAKPLIRDPVANADLLETEDVVLRLPPMRFS